MQQYTNSNIVLYATMALEDPALGDTASLLMMEPRTVAVNVSGSLVHSTGGSFAATAVRPAIGE